MRIPQKLRVALAGTALVALLAGCGTATAATTAASTSATSSVSSSATTASAVASSTVGASVQAVLAENQESHAQVDDLTYDATTVVDVTLTGSGATENSDAVSSSDGTVTISAPGTYRLTGSLAGQVVVDSAVEGKVRLVLDSASITSTSTAAISIVAADEAVVVLADGSTNSLTDGSSYGADGGANAALWSAADLTIGGNGTLAVTGNSNDGIASQDGLVIFGGTINVQAKDDGIRGKDYLRIEGGTLTVKAGGDGLKSDNEEDATRGYVAILGGTTTVTSGDDGVQAVTDAMVGAGSLTVTATGKAFRGNASATFGGGTSILKGTEGIEGPVITISDGSVDITASDDGINAANPASSGQGGGNSADASLMVTVSGGSLTINAQGDGLDSNGSMTISGGTVVVSGPTNGGNGALDVNGTLDVTGGTLLAAGSSGMAEAPDSSSTQGWLQASFASAYAAGTVVQVVSGDQVIATFTASKSFANLVFSSSAITNGTSYDIYLNGQPSGTATGGMTLDGSTSGATKLGAVTAGQASGGQGGPRN